MESFLQAIERYKQAPKKASKKLLVDGLDNPDFIMATIMVADILYREHDYQVFYLDNNTLSSKIFGALGYTPIKLSTLNKWGISLRSKIHYFYDLITRNFELSDDVLTLKIAGIPAGDLLIDTVAKFDSKKKFDLDFSIGNYLGWIKLSYDQFYFQKYLYDYKNFSCLIYSHTYYIYYGFLPRMAVNNGIDKAYLISCNSLFDESTWDNLLKSDYHYIHKHEEELYNISSEIIDRFISERFRGVYTDMCADRPYKDKISITKEELITTLELDPSLPICTIYLHAFADANHYEQEMIYHNYYEWFIKTVEIIKDLSNVNWIFKEHPYNDLFNEQGVVKRELGRLGLENKLIPAQFNAISILECCDAIVTVRGTVGMEAPLFGISPILAGYAYFDKYGFTINCKTEKDYINALQNIKFKTEPDKNKVEKAKRVLYASNHNFLTTSEIITESFNGLLTEDEVITVYNNYSRKINDLEGLENDNYYKKMCSFLRQNKLSSLTGFYHE